MPLSVQETHVGSWLEEHGEYKRSLWITSCWALWVVCHHPAWVYCAEKRIERVQFCFYEITIKTFCLKDESFIVLSWSNYLFSTNSWDDEANQSYRLKGGSSVLFYQILDLLNGFDFYFDLFWTAWHWKSATPPRLTNEPTAKFFLFFTETFITQFKTTENNQLNRQLKTAIDTFLN